MKWLLSTIALFGLSGLEASLPAQPIRSQRPSPALPAAQTPSTANPDNSVPQSQTDTAKPRQSARAFEGRIIKTDSQFVLVEDSTQTSYKLDDQSKARNFDGKDVKVMATTDPSNQLHVIDIIAIDTR